mgnify:CR=1 FL=1
MVWRGGVVGSGARVLRSVGSKACLLVGGVLTGAVFFALNATVAINVEQVVFRDSERHTLAYRFRSERRRKKHCCMRSTDECRHMNVALCEPAVSVDSMSSQLLRLSRTQNYPA